MARPLTTSSFVLLIAALLCVASAPVADAAMGMPAVHHGQKKKVTREAIEDLEEQWRQAQLGGDVAAMDRLLSDDFVGITASGQVTTKMQQMDRIRSRSIVLSQLDLSDIKVKLIGPLVAVVTSRAEIKGVSEGAPLAGTFRYTRVYQRLPSGVWKITSFEATRVPSSEGGSHNRAVQP